MQFECLPAGRGISKFTEPIKHLKPLKLLELLLAVTPDDCTDYCLPFAFILTPISIRKQTARS